MTQEKAGRREMLKTGVWQFAGSGDIDRNFCRIRRGIEAAAWERVRLLAFHECALTGYPPLDTAADEIDFGQAELYRQELKALAKEYSMYLFAGSAVGLGSGAFCGGRAGRNLRYRWIPGGNPHLF